MQDVGRAAARLEAEDMTVLIIWLSESSLPSLPQVVLVSRRTNNTKRWHLSQGTCQRSVQPLLCLGGVTVPSLRFSPPYRRERSSADKDRRLPKVELLSQEDPSI